MYELISDKDFESLPEEPEQKFVALEQICRRNMTGMISQDTTSGFDALVHMQYMTTVSAAAHELGITGIEFPYEKSHPADEINNFLLKTSGVVTRIRLRNTTANKPLSVRLAAKTRGRIEQQIQKLRHAIEEGDMPDNKRKSLLAKLDELSVELSQNRVSFGKVMAVLAFVSVGIVNGTVFLAEAPHAIATIASLLGADKQAEDAENLRLGPPPAPKTLPAPTKTPTRQLSIPATAARIEEDDDIPF